MRKSGRNLSKDPSPGGIKEIKLNNFSIRWEGKKIIMALRLKQTSQTKKATTNKRFIRLTLYYIA